MPTPEVAHAIRQSAISQHLNNVRRRYSEDAELHAPLDEAEVTRRILALQDQIAGHMRSHLPVLTYEDGEALGALALAIQIQATQAHAEDLVNAEG